MSSLLRRLLLILFALLLVLLGSVAWLAGTETGLQLVWQRLLVPLMPQLSAAEVRGRLIDGVDLRELRLDGEDQLVTIRSLELDWTPRELLNGILRIDRVAAQGVHYEPRGAGSDAPLELPQRITLPVAVELTELSVQDVVLLTAPGETPQQIDSLRLAGSFRNARLQVTRLALRLASLSVDGHASLQTHDAYAVDGELHTTVQQAGYAPLESDTRLSGNLSVLQIEQAVAPPYALKASIALTNPLTELQLEGKLEMQQADLAVIRADWPGMQLAGSIDVSGPPDDLQLEGRVDIRDAMAETLQLVFAGRFGPQAVQVDRLQLTANGQPARLMAEGTIGLGAQPTFDFQADWQALAWPLTGTADYASRQGHFSLAGTPDNYALDASGDLRYRDLLDAQLDLRARSGSEPGSWQIETARLTRGTARVSAAGLVGNQFALDWQIEAPDLSALSPQTTGSLHGDGRLAGSPPALSVTLRARGEGIVFQQHRIDALRIDGDIRLDDTQASRLQATLEQAVLAGSRIERFAIDGSGTMAGHGLALTLASEYGNAELDATARWDGSTWHFTVPQARLSPVRLPTWQLEQALSGAFSQTGGLQLAEHCWVAAGARACGRFEGTAAAYNGKLSVDQLPLSYLSAWAEREYRLEGKLNASGNFGKTQDATARAEVRLDSTPLTLQLPQEGTAESWRLAFAPAAASLNLGKSQASLSLALPFAETEGGVEGQLDLRLPADGDWMQGTLDGAVTLLWPDISPAASWLPEVDSLNGRLDGRMQVGGTPVSPQLLGRLELSGGGASLAKPGLLLEDISLVLLGQPTGEVQLNAALRSGGGILKGEGVVDPQARTAALTFDGSEFQVMNLPEAQIFVSPALQLSIDSEQIRVAGEIEVPTARLRPRTLPATAVSVSSDQILVDEADEALAASPYAIDARIRVVLGEAVDIEGFGLSGKLRGAVELVDVPAQPASATGELAISDGRYKAYGQDLDIRTGRLLYAGGVVTQPGLDIEAVRTPAPDVLVGVKVRGSMQSPQFKVFSEPAMSQSAQLSWLVLGRPLERGASENERSAMQSAALMLGLSGGESLGKAVGEELGLDEVTIGAGAGGDQTQATLQVGKYLTPELFVSYGIGLFEPLSTLRMRYALSSRWKLVGEATTQSSSADLVYEIERQ